MSLELKLQDCIYNKKYNKFRSIVQTNKDRLEDTNYLHFICQTISSYGENYSKELEDSEKFVEILLEEGYNPNKVESNGNTPLHRACMFSAISQILFLKIDYLLDYRAKVNFKNNNGRTPLHLLFMLNFNNLNGDNYNIDILLMIIELLIDNGASLFIKDNYNQTPLDILVYGYRDYFESRVPLYGCLLLNKIIGSKVNKFDKRDIKFLVNIFSNIDNETCSDIFDRLEIDIKEKLLKILNSYKITVQDKLNNVKYNNNDIFLKDQTGGEIMKYLISNC